MLLDIALIRLAKVQYELEKSEEALATLQKVKTKGFLSWALELKVTFILAKRLSLRINLMKGLSVSLKRAWIGLF